jgi:hypothetical protein
MVSAKIAAAKDGNMIRLLSSAVDSWPTFAALGAQYTAVPDLEQKQIAKFR